MPETWPAGAKRNQETKAKRAEKAESSSPGKKQNRNEGFFRSL
jgi:hypothetical protein